MSSPRRLLVILVDRSGSMRAVKDDTEGGLRAFLDAQRDVPGETRVTLRRFDHEHETLYTGIPLEEAPAFELKPRGWTALLDAIGSSVAETDDHIASLPEGDRPDEVVLVVLTDGAENASKEWKHSQIKTLLKAKQDAGWTVVFLGADQDAITVAAGMGISRDTSLAYDSCDTEATLTTVGRAVARGSRTGVHGFTDAERDMRGSR